MAAGGDGSPLGPPEGMAHPQSLDGCDIVGMSGLVVGALIVRIEFCKDYKDHCHHIPRSLFSQRMSTR